MAYKNCIRCSTRWTLDVDSCPFCGGPAQDAEIPAAVEASVPRPSPAPAIARRAYHRPAPPPPHRAWWKFWG